MSGAPNIFDRKLLHDRRARQARRSCGKALPDFLLAHAAEDVIERLALIKRRFSKAISVGSYHGTMARRLRDLGVDEVTETDMVADLLERGGGGPSAVIADEEALPFAEGSFDLAVSVLALQYVNDLPGTLARIRRLLCPDGLFIGVVLGGATLNELRQAMLMAEIEMRGGASPRIMPFVDVRDAGGLLQRAGFALPVSDADTLMVSYATALDLMRELKAMGATNVLSERARVPVTRSLLLRAAEIYAEHFPAADGTGRVVSTFELVTLTGWSPDPSQQRSLRPGSAQVRLADALRLRDDRRE
jgi:SAM-dependent methyltransferase